MIVPEAELRQVAMQMALSAMLVDPAHSALEDAEAAFDRVGVNLLPGKLASAVANMLMLGKVLVHPFVEATFVGIERTFAVDIFLDQLRNVDLRCLLDVEIANLPLALMQAKDSTLS